MACIAEMGTGKTLMAMSIAHVFAAGRPYACLFVVPPQLLQKTAREILQTIPGARVYVIDSLRSQRPGQAGPHGVNEFRLRNGRIIRDGVHTTLTEMRLRGKHKSAWDRWVAEHGPGPHYVICGRDRAKLGAFWRPSFQVARCGNHNGAIVNPDSGRPIVFDDERLLRDDFDRQERFAETLESVALCGGEKTKPRRPLYSPLWQVDGSRIRRYAPIEFIGRYLPHFFKFGIADEVHEAKAADTAQGNALGTLAAAVDKMIVLTGTLTGGMASDVFNVLYRIDPKRMVSQGYEYGEAGIRSFTETYGVLETITTIEPQENACSKAKITRRVKERPGASPLLFARFLMDLGAFVSLEDISANLPPYTEEVISVPMDKPLAEAYEELEQDIAAALQEHRGNSSVISTALNALLLYPDRPFSMGQLWGVAYDEETKRRERFLIADPPDLDESIVYAKERRLVELVQSEVQNRRGVQVYATYTQKRDVTRRIESILSQRRHQGSGAHYTDTAGGKRGLVRAPAQGRRTGVYWSSPACSDWARLCGIWRLSRIVLFETSCSVSKAGQVKAFARLRTLWITVASRITGQPFRARAASRTSAATSSIWPRGKEKASFCILSAKATRDLRSPWRTTREYASQEYANNSRWQNSVSTNLSWPRRTCNP